MANKQTSNRLIDVVLKRKGINTSTVAEKQILSKESFVPGVVFSNGSEVFTLVSGVNQLYIEDLKSEQILDVEAISDVTANVCLNSFGCKLSGLLIYSNYEVISTPANNKPKDND